MLVILYSSSWVYEKILQTVLVYAPDRFAAMIPIPFVIAFVISNVCCSMKGKERIVALIAAAFLIFYMSDSSYESFYNGVYRIENVYGLPQDIVDICDIILEDSEDGQPLILVSADDIDYFRQYSSDIKIANVGVGSMPSIAYTCDEYEQLYELLYYSQVLEMSKVGELAASCGIDYIIINTDKYSSISYYGESYYATYRTIGSYKIYRVIS